METRDFAKLEDACQLRFIETGNCYHVCSSENHPVIFHNEAEFKNAMNIVAYSALLVPELKIFTFEIMSNHFHFAVSGNTSDINVFTRCLVAKLASIPCLKEYGNDIKSLDFKIFPVNSIETFRNVIAYINRNGSVVVPNENVFTYRWGANRYFFNREARLRFKESGRKATCRDKRSMFHSCSLDNRDIVVLDGYVSPENYCHIDDSEAFFRNSRHYFHNVARNIESSRDIARTIGESLFYTDDDLYAHIRAVCTKQHGGKLPSMLPADEKINLARELHFDYKAGNKQISRLLKMDMQILSGLFPENR